MCSTGLRAAPCGWCHKRNIKKRPLKGDASVVITDLAAKKRVDLIVMGTVCRNGMAGFFIGNNAENVLQQVDCSMLTVKPESFVSPVVLEKT